MLLFILEILLNALMAISALMVGGFFSLSIATLIFRTRNHAAMYVVFEGIDGSGKETQSKLLEKKLQFMGKKVIRISYPEYGKWHCRLVEMYLKGKFGKNAMKINPVLVSSLYAVDRFFSLYIHSKKFDDNTIVIFDRYVTSNLIFQLAKIDNYAKRISLMSKLEYLEYNFFKIPRPDAVFYMNIDPDFAISVLQNRSDNKHGSKKDIHEENFDILKKAAMVGNEIVSISSNWQSIPVSMEDITGKHVYLPAESIHASIWKIFDARYQFKNKK